jgi:hypothetical protein
MSRGGTLLVMATGRRSAARPGSSGRQAIRPESCITLRPLGLSCGWRWLLNGPSLLKPGQHPIPEGSASFLVRGRAPNKKPLVMPLP